MAIKIQPVKCPILNSFFYKELNLSSFPSADAVIRYSSLNKPSDIMCKGFNDEKRCSFDGNESNHRKCIYSEWKNLFS
ncbi:MAG: hypothetical protein AABW81_03675 [Nanoarchaeota archaeon]